MKLAAIWLSILLLNPFAGAQVIKQNGGSAAVSLSPSVACTGTGINFDSGTAYVDCSNNKFGVLSTAPANEFHIGSGGQANIYQSMQTDSRTWKTGIGQAGGDDAYVIQDVNAGTTRVTITTGGNIGIGTTIPSSTLHVAGTSQFGSGATISTFTTTGNIQLVSGSTITSAGTLTISTAASVSATDMPAIFVDVAGQVGINTKSPLDTFHVGGTAFANLYTRYQTDSRSWRLGFGQSGGDDNLILQDATAGATRFRINTTGDVFIAGTASGANPTLLVRNAGDVGIGSGSPTIPATTLEVSGSLSTGSGATKSTFTTTGRLILDPAAGHIPSVRTKAQMDAITGVVGLVYICSDCTVPYDICVGTGTALSGFRAVVNSAINTAVPGTLVNKGCGSGN